MSKGPGVVERRIADLFAATRDRPLGIGEIAAYAFELGDQPASRVQRLSATRAANRVIRRRRDDRERARELYAEARRNTEAELGSRPQHWTGQPGWEQWSARIYRDQRPAAGDAGICPERRAGCLPLGEARIAASPLRVTAPARPRIASVITLRRAPDGPTNRSRRYRSTI